MFRNRSDFKSYVSGKVKYFRSRSLSGSYSYVIGDTAQTVLDKGQPPANGVFRPFDRRDNSFAAGIANRYLHFSSQICPRSQSRISGSSTRATTSVR